MTALLKKPSRRRAPRGFYHAALDAAERLELQEASRVDGLDHEIALLRLRLKQAVQDRPGDFELMFRGIDLLVRAVSSRYRLSKESQSQLQESVAAAMRGLRQLAPGEDDGDVQA